ncbi:MAG: cytochrome c [Deinococcus-Thermus bacterium]|jgi:cytochrome c556|nr:cytochrome c [Deinococcota bacterium]
MSIRKTMALALCIGVAGAALAHQGVENPAVKARMESMKDAASGLETIGEMAKGARAFDADAASGARTRLVSRMEAIPVLFEDEAHDPKDEARDRIWEEWADFRDHADEAAAAAAGLDVSSRKAIRASLRDLGGACRGCHESYRIDE